MTGTCPDCPAEVGAGRAIDSPVIVVVAVHAATCPWHARRSPDGTDIFMATVTGDMLIVHTRALLQTLVQT